MTICRPDIPECKISTFLPAAKQRFVIFVTPRYRETIDANLPSYSYHLLNISCLLNYYEHTYVGIKIRYVVELHCLSNRYRQANRDRATLYVFRILYVTNNTN